MEVALIAIATTGIATLISYLGTRKVQHTVRYRKQTKAEIVLEQKELGRWIISEMATLNAAKKVPPKEQVKELLDSLEIFYKNADLWEWSKSGIGKCLDSARTALDVVEEIDRRYIVVLNLLVEAVVTAVLRISGSEENATQFMKTKTSLGGISHGFKYLSGGEMDMKQWKNEAMKKDKK